MADPIHLGRLVARADTYPQADAYAGHVRHFRGGDRQAVGELADLIHKKMLHQAPPCAGFNVRR